MLALQDAHVACHRAKTLSAEAEFVSLSLPGQPHVVRAQWRHVWFSS